MTPSAPFVLCVTESAKGRVSPTTNRCWRTMPVISTRSATLPAAIWACRATFPTFRCDKQPQHSTLLTLSHAVLDNGTLDRGIVANLRSSGTPIWAHHADAAHHQRRMKMSGARQEAAVVDAGRS